MSRTKTLILGAAGRDFHNFNTVFRNDADTEVVGFTATQIPNIDGRQYPAALAGEHYPDGIPIHAEDDLEKLIGELGVEQVVFAYSDVSHEYVMHLASRSIAAGRGLSVDRARAHDDPVVEARRLGLCGSNWRWQESDEPERRQDPD